MRTSGSCPPAARLHWVNSEWSFPGLPQHSGCRLALSSLPRSAQLCTPVISNSTIPRSAASRPTFPGWRKSQSGSFVVTIGFHLRGTAGLYPSERIVGESLTGLWPKPGQGNCCYLLVTVSRIQQVMMLPENITGVSACSAEHDGNRADVHRAGLSQSPQSYSGTD